MNLILKEEWRMMKKRFAMILTAALTISTVLPVMAADDVVGDWYGNVFGMGMTLNIAEDGTYVIDGMGETATGAWTLDDDTLTLTEEEAEDMVFTYDGESISTDMDGIEFLFSRDPEALEGFVPAEIREDAAIEDFEGKWGVDQVSAFEMMIPTDMLLDQLGVEDITLTVEKDGVVDFAIKVPEGEFSFIDAKNLEDAKAEFKDGALNLFIPAESEYYDDENWVINSLEDGTISMSWDMGEDMGAMIFYMSELTEE